MGYLNDKYFAYHEDEEYCMRVARAGYRAIVVPEARVFHKNSRSTGSNDAPMQVFLRSRNLFFLWMDHLKGDGTGFPYSEIPGPYHFVRGFLEGKKPSRFGGGLPGRGVARLPRRRGPRNPKITMPIPLRRLFRFLFSWHPFLWASLLLGDFPELRQT